MITTRLPAITLLVLLLPACSSPTIDGSTEESFGASTASIAEQLPDEARREFEEALLTVMLDAAFSADDVGDFGGWLEAMQGAEQRTDVARTRLHGMTASEVVDEAKRIEERREERIREQELRELETLRERRAAAAYARIAMKDFVITGARFYSERGYLGREPRVRMTMTNGTDVPVSRGYFRAVVTTAGRATPWIDEDFNYTIRGGIEPGESQTVTLSPNAFLGGWNTEVRGDPVLTVTVTGLEGPDGEVLFMDDFTDTDEQRLQELQARYERR